MADLSQAQIDAALTALGFPPPPGSLRDLQAVIATEMGLHRYTVQVRLEGTHCIVEVPAKDLDDKRRRYVRRALGEASRFAVKAGATSIEIVAVGPAETGIHPEK